MKEFKQPLVARKLKRKFESAHDNSLDSVLKNQEKVREEIEKIGEMDLEKVINAYKDIKDQRDICVMLGELYKELFLEDMKSVENIDTDISGVFNNLKS